MDRTLTLERTLTPSSVEPASAIISVITTTYVTTIPGTTFVVTTELPGQTTTNEYTTTLPEVTQTITSVYVQAHLNCSTVYMAHF